MSGYSADCPYCAGHDGTPHERHCPYWREEDGTLEPAPCGSCGVTHDYVLCPEAGDNVCNCTFHPFEFTKHAKDCPANPERKT